MTTIDNGNAAHPYFDFITTGVAYVNRVKQIFPQAGGRVFTPYWTAKLAVLVSKGNDVQYRYIDCTIPAEEAEKLVCLYMAEANNQAGKVLAGVRIADLHAETFTKKDGEVVPCLKGRLIKISWLKVNGKMVFKASSVVEQATSPA
jgi:hypothetical protein